jgi:hypothetical protein
MDTFTPTNTTHSELPPKPVSEKLLRVAVFELVCKVLDFVFMYRDALKIAAVTTAFSIFIARRAAFRAMIIAPF